MSVTITALEAENVKRIKAVALTPAPTGLTLVGGNNNQGKTSVLDALAWALGGEKFRPSAAVRDGAIAPAHLKVTLSNGVVVERKGKNSTLTVTDPTGRRSGQQLLNAFVEPLALDLPRFMEASDKEKADTLLRIIGIGSELHVRDLEIKSLYDKRTFTGQLAQQKKHFAEELISYPDAPGSPSAPRNSSAGSRKFWPETVRTSACGRTSTTSKARPARWPTAAFSWSRPLHSW